MADQNVRVTRRCWGEAEGAAVWLLGLEGEGIGLRVSNYGGVIQALTLDDPGGRPVDVVLGYDTLDEYRRSDTFFGAMIGPVADRMAEGRCTLDGREVRLPRNAGPDSMHCGARGFHRVVWNWEPLADGIRLFRTFEAADTGFPGVMAAELRCRLPSPRTLRLEYAAECTRETAASFTNHSYFNLGGGREDCSGHVLTVHAGRYAETVRRVDPICTGQTLPVDGTPLDLRRGVRVGDAASATDFREIAAAGGVDHYFPVEGEGMREVARLRCPANGLALRCRSDAPGLLAYTANGLAGERGKGGAIYGPRWGVCLETERFPNGVNLPDRRGQVLLEPGERYASATEFAFDWGEKETQPVILGKSLLRK